MKYNKCLKLMHCRSAISIKANEIFIKMIFKIKNVALGLIIKSKGSLNLFTCKVNILYKLNEL